MTTHLNHDRAAVVPHIERALATGGERTAVRGPDGELTCAELSARAWRLARDLQGSGIGRGDIVGLCLERSAALVVSALAVLRTGAAYLAMDPAYPDARLDWMLADAGAAAVLADAATAPRLAAAGAPVVTVQRYDGDEGAEPLPGVPRPGDLAYVVYTSGSTGEPKGVLVDHAGLANLVAWHLGAFGLTASDTTTQIASPGFDASVWELWPSLAAGATIHIVPDALRHDPRALRDWLVAEGISVSFVPTVVAEGLIALDWPSSARLRVLLTGGDALARGPRPGLPFTLVNNYGLSETTVVATSGAVAAGDGSPPIGRPIPGVEAEVVDEHLEPVADGEAGELLIGGVALARGYLGRPALTHERFLETARGRRYRTGDRVRRRAEGELEFLGRLDDQLSVRGFRVEPGEVARVLNAHPGVATSLVVGDGQAGAARGLVAYVVAADPAGSPRPGDRELAMFLSASLPAYMVPARYVWIDAVPLTAHGKVDRDALPRAGVEPGSSGRLPGSETEAEIAELIAGLLGVESVGLDENFFLLGGHSMLGAQLIVRLEERYGVEIGLRYLFDHPTPAEVAAEVTRAAAETRVAG